MAENAKERVAPVDRPAQRDEPRVIEAYDPVPVTQRERQSSPPGDGATWDNHNTD